MKLSFYISIAIILGFLVFTSSCSEETKTPKKTLTGNFYVRYLEKGSTERTEAHLFLLDTSKNKTPYVLSEGIELSKDKMNSKWISDKLHRYQLEKKIAFREKVDFKLKDLSGNELTNSISMIPLKNLTLPEEIKLDNGIKLDFSKSKLDFNEKLNILFTNENGLTKVVSVLGPQNSSYRINLLEQDIKKGPWSYYFVKRKEQIREGNNIFLHNAYEYYSTDRQTLIK
jgi:hypothetical protein